MKTFNIHNCTLQQACDYAVQQIVKQGCRSMDGTGSCAYRQPGTSNVRCAIGWLMPMDLLDAAAPLQKGFYDMIEDSDCKPLLPPLFHQHDYALSELQSFHDKVTEAARRACAQEMHDTHGIDTSGAQWQQWIEMGEYR